MGTSIGARLLCSSSSLRRVVLGLPDCSVGLLGHRFVTLRWFRLWNEVMPSLCTDCSEVCCWSAPHCDAAVSAGCGWQWAVGLRLSSGPERPIQLWQVVTRTGRLIELHGAKA
eukprot:GHUV01020757.1.p2 GENE.GHUV01020757.1~~GHUV01020757.1.p2  ORF type:complete len:113 (-),score=0.40 GHUV01020757.1:993-1331(-)